MRGLAAFQTAFSALAGGMSLLGLFLGLTGSPANDATPMILFAAVALLAYAGVTGFGLLCATGRGPRAGAAALFLPTLAALLLVLNRAWFLPNSFVLLLTLPGAVLGARALLAGA